MKKLLLGAFALALVALVLGFALPSDSYQLQQSASEGAIVTNSTDLVAATDTDVGQAVTAFYTSALIDSTALGLTPTSSAIDPGGGTIMVAALLGSTGDMVFSASRASPPTSRSVLDDGTTNSYATTTASRASPASSLAVLGSGDNNSTTTMAWWTATVQAADSAWIITMTTAALICGALALGIVTALILVCSYGGARFRWSTMTRGHAPMSTNEIFKTGAAQTRHHYALAFGAT